MSLKNHDAQLDGGAPVFASAPPRRKAGSRRDTSAIARRQISIPPSDADVAKLKAQAQALDDAETDWAQERENLGDIVSACKTFITDGVVVATPADFALMFELYKVSKSVFECMLRNADVHDGCKILAIEAERAMREAAMACPDQAWAEKHLRDGLSGIASRVPAMVVASRKPPRQTDAGGGGEDDDGDDDDGGEEESFTIPGDDDGSKRRKRTGRGEQCPTQALSKRSCASTWSSLLHTHRRLEYRKQELDDNCPLPMFFSFGFGRSGRFVTTDARLTEFEPRMRELYGLPRSIVNSREMTVATDAAALAASQSLY